jgi:thiol-disulfide isomerase/thioredoxin
MTIKIKLIISAVFLSLLFRAQTVTQVYKIKDLLTRIDTSKMPLVINFWATWCKPCVQELPAFDSLSTSKNTCQVILVSLDFKEDIDKKVNPFLKKNNIVSECVLLDEINGNDYINKISEKWSGAIPATIFIGKEKTIFEERKLKLIDLLRKLGDLEKK